MSMLTRCCPGTEAGWLATLYQPRYQPAPTTVSDRRSEQRQQVPHGLTSPLRMMIGR